MSQIFLSYSSKNKELVQTLAQNLEIAGNQIWFDNKLTGGQAWWDQILEQIRGCDLFIFALTPEAINSYPCKLEYQYAYRLGKNVLPVLISDGVSVNLLPPELTTIQFIDFRSGDQQAPFRLMNALNNLATPKPLPDPLPEPPPVPISYIGQLKDQIDAPQTLNFDEQASLVLKLKEHLQETDTREDAITLLKQFRKRNELYARIGEEIDELLSTAPQAAVVQKPVQRPIITPRPAGTVSVQTAATGEDKGWSNLVVGGLAVATLFIPLVGIIAGVIAMRSPINRNRGIGLLVFGIVMGLYYVIGASSGGSFF